ncbi:hypothetical protein B7P43_G05272, partial [Cryptotermes secundus]
PRIEEMFGDAEIYFQQDGAPLHYHREVRPYFSTTLSDRSPELTPMDFFLWGYPIDKVYAATPATVRE